MKQHFTTCVVGSGPASIALVGKLLDKNFRNICWIDPNWNGGRLKNYYEVPSNTKVKLFTEFGKVCDSFSGINSCARVKMEALDPEKGCPLQYPCEMVVEYANELVEKYKINKYVGCVAAIHKNDKFELDLTKDKIDLDAANPYDHCSVSDQITCDSLYLTTGSKPIIPPSGAHEYNSNCKVLSLDIGLSPTLLKQAISPNAKVAVIGNSHSAILVLRNLAALNCQVSCYYRRPLKYAEYMDGWIKYDNTGLKGEAAEWARNDLQHQKNIKLVQLLNEEKQYSRDLPHFDFLIYSIGYKPRTLPPIFVNKKLVPVTHDQFTGQLYYKNGTRSDVDGLFGYGIAFPESVTDKAGNVESSVGMWKFMNYMNKVFS